MADVLTQSAQLKFEAYFVDGDTRTFTLKNPKGSISTSEIEELQTLIRQNNLLIGDKMGGTFGKFDAVTRITENKYHLDFVNND